VKSRLGLVALGLTGLLTFALYVRERNPPRIAAEPPQRASTESPLDSLIAWGESRYWEGEFESAQTIWSDALVRSREIGNPKSEAQVLTWLALAAYRTGEYAEARRLGEEALTLKLRLGPGVELSKSYNALGLLAWNEGRLVDAIQLFDQATTAALRESDQEMAAKAANNLGLVFSDLGEFVRARASFEASLAAGRELGDALIEGRTLSNLGMLEIQIGNPDAGLIFLSEARLRYRTSGDIAGELNTLGQLATAYAALGEPSRAFAVLDSSLVLARQYDLRSEEASSLELLAGLYRGAGDYRRALDLYEQARRFNRELGLQIEEGNNLQLEAEIYARLGDLARARSLAGQAANLHHTTGSMVDELNDLLLLAELDHLSGKTSEASRHLDGARSLAHRLGARSARENLALTEARIADHSADPRKVLRILSAAMPDLSQASYHTLWEAEVLRARAHARSGNLEAAVAAGYRAVAVVERVRERFGSGFLRTAFLADRQTAYTDLIDVLLRQGKVEEAFEIADAARGRAFLEHLAAAPEIRGKNDGMAQTLAEGERLLREIDQLVVRRNELEASPPEEGDPSADRLNRRLDELRSQYEEILVRVAERGAGVAGLLGGHRIRSTEITRTLRTDEILLEYVVTSRSIIIFAITHDKVESFTIAMPVEDLVRRVRVANELAGRQTGQPSSLRVLESLHRALIGPLAPTGPLARVRRIIIVPDAILGHVPFAALRDAESGRYLVERYAISYLPAAAALPLLRGGDRRDWLTPSRTIPVSVFVPFPEGLPATRREGSEIRRTLGGVRVIEGRNATEEDLRRELSTGRIVHVASHGALEPSNPLFSRIELSRGGDPPNDGRLEVHEILGLTIRSPLVFLSGCETERGPARSSTFAVGDDYATLARAFLYAGAQAVIATLWRIDDDGAAIFASRFYYHLRGSLPDEALARAQRDLIRSTRYSTPFYWASYRLAGGGAPGP
jgi:CHAT domain-containing protein